MGANTMQETEIIQAAFSISILIFSVVAHEVSHGYMAQYLGDSTARLAGRLTMNPIRHIDPMGSIFVPIFAFLSFGFVFGWAKPVPYNPYNLRDQKWGDTKVALAGPLTNFAIALFFGLLIRFGGSLLSGPVFSIMDLIVYINLIRPVFNLVPIPPLDGSKVLLNALPLKYSYIGNYLQRYSLLLILFFAMFLWKFILPIVSFFHYLFVGG